MGVEVIDTEFDSATDGLSDSSGRASLHVGAAEIDVEAPGRPNGSVAWDRWGHFCTPASHTTGTWRETKRSRCEQRDLMVRDTGIEPVTSSVSGKRSPAELIARV